MEHPLKNYLFRSPQALFFPWGARIFAKKSGIVKN